MANTKSTPTELAGRYEQEYAALDAAYRLLLSGSGLLRTADVAIESGAEELSRTAVSETAIAALKKLKEANELLEFGHTESPLLELIDAVRAPLWDVLDLVFVASHVIEDVNLPNQSEEDAEDRPTSAHPESALLRVAAEMAAGDGLGSVAAKVAQLQQRIREGTALEVANG